MPFKLILLGILFLLTIGGMPAESVTLYFTGSLNGNLDGCDCHDAPRAGLVKTAVEIRARDIAGSIFIDGGDRLDVIKDPVLGDFVDKAYAGLQPDFLLPGDQDFINGTDFIKENSYSLPFASANMKVRGTELGRHTGISLRKKGIDFYIVGLVDPRVQLLIPSKAASAITISNPQNILDMMKVELKEKRVNILVFHGYEESIKALIDNNRGVFDMALLIHEQKYIDPVDYSGTLLFSPGPRGNRVGIIEMDLRKDSIKKWNWHAYAPDYVNSPDDLQVRKMVISYYDSLSL